jgi:Winged helix-turn helix
MRKPLYIRPWLTDERQTLQEGWRSSDACVLRRCHILLASARGQTARVIAETLGGDDQTVRHALHAFKARGLAALRPGSSVPQRPPPAAFTPPNANRGVPSCTSARAPVATLPVGGLGLEPPRWRMSVAYVEGLTSRRVSGEAIRRALARLGVCGKRAKHWLTSPAPAYAREKNVAPA